MNNGVLLYVMQYKSTRVWWSYITFWIIPCRK